MPRVVLFQAPLARWTIEFYISRVFRFALGSHEDMLLVAASGAIATKLLNEASLLRHISKGYTADAAVFRPLYKSPWPLHMHSSPSLM